MSTEAFTVRKREVCYFLGDNWRQYLNPRPPLSVCTCIAPLYHRHKKRKLRGLQKTKGKLMWTRRMMMSRMTLMMTSSGELVCVLCDLLVVLVCVLWSTGLVLYWSVISWPCSIDTQILWRHKYLLCLTVIEKTHSNCKVLNSILTLILYVKLYSVVFFCISFSGVKLWKGRKFIRWKL